VIELQLIGYTEDAEHLVLDLEADGDGRYTVRIDPDLLATVAQLRDVRIEQGLPVDRPSEVTDDAPVPPPLRSQLSPAEIQAQLRAGRSVRVVAAAAGTDAAWIERWLPPITAERERVLAEARRRTLDVPGARPLGDSVDEALAARGIDEEQRRWSATRRDDGRWRVTVRFEDDGRPRTASWTMDPGGERIRPASRLAGDLAGPTSRSTRRR
jgi:hypothetical protein